MTNPRRLDRRRKLWLCVLLTACLPISSAHSQIVPTDLESVKSRLGIADWPNGIGQIDLGDRVIDVIPTPGHYPSHVAYYDRQTGLFFSGDFLLPGRLLIEDTNADLASARRVAEFVEERPVTYVLGAHIELDQSGKVFLGTRYHQMVVPVERIARSIFFSVVANGS
jgi:glyoxylase-like metal-dependent hydrolase (beta-lactamase superfamily II)